MKRVPRGRARKRAFVCESSSVKHPAHRQTVVIVSLPDDIHDILLRIRCACSRKIKFLHVSFKGLSFRSENMNAIWRVMYIQDFFILSVLVLITKIFGQFYSSIISITYLVILGTIWYKRLLINYLTNFERLVNPLLLLRWYNRMLLFVKRSLGPQTMMNFIMFIATLVTSIGFIDHLPLSASPTVGFSVTLYIPQVGNVVYGQPLRQILRGDFSTLPLP